MPTRLSEFCEHFDGVVRELIGPLEASIEALENAADSLGADRLKTPLAELRHDVLALCDKVLGQQAYMLIFGPLKSGKSTLMNALAASYVSEVSSLPAYPCLVFVGDDNVRSWRVTRYDGSSQVFSTTDDLTAEIDRAHEELARRIRATEQSGATFDPQEHFPRAIRRVDVRLPAPSLRRSGAVLVDTPGLYTRMRFGYDRMTKDFRNAAACAVFVVKSDTLFLEQVFAEFNQLLELFSRVFLVVNTDASKRDVGPRGELLPSLEQSSPGRIIEAFESLAMSAPLARAAKEGRVRFFPVNLMHAASTALGAPDDETPAEDFARFRGELDRYLASTEYLRAFLSDSLRRANSLMGETERAADRDQVHELRATLSELRIRRDEGRVRLERISRCLDRDWSDAFSVYSSTLSEEVRRTANDRGARLARGMGAAIDTWLLSSHSLKWLIENEWAPLVRDLCDAVRASAERFFDREVGDGTVVPPEVQEDLGALGIDVFAVRRTAHASLSRTSYPGRLPPVLDVDAIPVKRSLLDLATFRSVDDVRIRLFGPNENPDRKVKASAKRRHLSDPGKHFLHQSVVRYRKELVEQVVEFTLARFGRDLNRATVEELVRLLRAREPDARDETARLENEADRITAVLEPMTDLARSAADVRQKVRALSSQYAAADPEELFGTEDPADPEPDVDVPRPEAGVRRGEQRRRARSDRDRG